MPSDLVIAALIATIPGTLGVLVSLWNARTSSKALHNIERIEKNTNSISERNEAIAKELGVVEGKQIERDNPTTPATRRTRSRD